MSIVYTSLKHPKLTFANCLYLHDSYISKFELINYLFANMVHEVAWLYHPETTQKQATI